VNNDVQYVVGDLLIDPGRCRVVRGAQEIYLPKLSFDLLLVLTRAAPNLLSIDELVEKVWPGLVVTPETVSQRVKLLRDALGDDAKAPRYIAGLRGRGYQIIAHVEEVPIEHRPSVKRSGSLDPGGAAMAASEAFTAAKRGIAIALIATTLLVLAAFVSIYSTGSQRDQSNAASVAAFAPPPRSVAVLPFVNMSGDPADEYFSDGLSEELVHALSRVHELRVSARTSSFSFKGTPHDIQAVARRLNVGTVLEGSVRKSGSRVRITAQLINALDGYHLWSHTYDREMKDVLALQTEIARAVAGTMQVTLLGDAQRKLAVGGTRNAQAFDAYLRGRHGESIQDEQGLRSALAALDEAIALDPEYADAHAFRAEVLAQLANIWEQDAHERQRLNVEARSAAEKAVAMAPQSGLAHSILGNVLSVTTDDYARIDAEYRRSIELEPGSAELLLGYASYGALFGRRDALSAAKRALGLDPLSASAHANLGVALFYARRHDEAREAFLEAGKLGTNRLTENWSGVNELAAGDAEAALPYCERDPDFWYDQWCLAIVYYRLDRRREAAAMFERLKKAQGDGGAYQYAQIHAQWGEPRAALAWLSKAVELKDAGLIGIKVDPFLDPVRKLPEFEEIVRKLDLPS
jgi:TolB-like protein/DNA-binding winged helix-turn-helix (wHTH) protein